MEEVEEDGEIGGVFGQVIGEVEADEVDEVELIDCLRDLELNRYAEML